MSVSKIGNVELASDEGKVRLLFRFYLEPGDARYDEYHIQIPIIPEGGYPGELDGEGLVVNREDLDSWLKTLPTRWVDAPFHNHYVKVNADINDKEILQLMKDYLKYFYELWSNHTDIVMAWKPEGRLDVGDNTPAGIDKCKERITDIISKPSIFEYGKF